MKTSLILSCGVCKTPLTVCKTQQYASTDVYICEVAACPQRGEIHLVPAAGDPFRPEPKLDIDACAAADVRIKQFSTGVISSVQPPLELIPLSAIQSLALRFGRGIRIKGHGGAWNAFDNPNAALDPDFVVDRLAHGIMHSFKAIGRLKGTVQPIDPQESADGGDAGAIMFAGALLAEHLSERAVPVQASTTYAEEPINADFSSGTNAREWAQAFSDIVGIRGFGFTDIDTLTGWFANAIERGRSAGLEQANKTK